MEYDPFQNTILQLQSTSKTRSNARIDFALVVDTGNAATTTNLELRITRLIERLSETTSNYRVALVSYGSKCATVHQSLTNNVSAIEIAARSMVAKAHEPPSAGVCNSDLLDRPGVSAALNETFYLPWLPLVSKTMVVLTSNSSTTTPWVTTNEWTLRSIGQNIEVNVIAAGHDTAVDGLRDVARKTGGVSTTMSSSETDLSDVAERVLNKPLVWLPPAYSGMVEKVISFDASGSFDPSVHHAIESYEWDFDGDFIFDTKTNSSIVAHAYNEVFEGRILLRITSTSGCSALYSSYVSILPEKPYGRRK